MSTTETIAPTGTWALDPVHSLVGFEVSYMAGTFRGQFRDVSVSLAIGDDGDAALEGVFELLCVCPETRDLVVGVAPVASCVHAVLPCRCSAGEERLSYSAKSGLLD